MKIIVSILILVSFFSCRSEKNEKEFFIDNIDKVEKFSDDFFIIDSLSGFYNEKTIMITSDSSFVIVCWVDRNSFWNNIISDKMIQVDIPYSRYKEKDIEIDLKLLNLINEKK